MCLAKKCDRCGIYYDQRNISFKNQFINGIMLIDRKVNNEAQFGRLNIDLCPECLNSLVDWLAYDEKENKDDQT